MKKRILSLIISFVMIAVFSAGAGTPVYAASSSWDGKSIDVSWFSPEKSEYHISTGAQLAGLAALVNGIYNKGCKVTAGQKSYITDNKSVNDRSSGPGGNNLSTAEYHYGAYNFAGKTVYLDADIDMSAGNYMPVGGQYLMEKENFDTKISSSFCGTFDGQGHIVNIRCDRHCKAKYGDGSSVGLIGRLGVHDNDEVPAGSPTVRNVIVTGYIYANRSVGGIVGKIGQTENGGTIENCANYADINNTDAKGIGGIAGAAWNAGEIRNCFNRGRISSTYRCPAGGIAGSNEITVKNCYSTGKVTAANDSYAMAIGTNNGGMPKVTDCCWLAGSAPGGGYYSSNRGTENGSVVKTESEMKSAETAAFLGEAFVSDKNSINDGYPVLKIMESRKTSPDRTVAKMITGALKVSISASKVSAGNKVTVKVSATALKDAGYTVKYRFYRSVKKSSGYALVKTSAGKVYKDTKAVKGKKYYYKARVYVYEGSSLIASTAMKTCAAAAVK